MKKTMKKIIFKSLLLPVFLLFSICLTAQTAPDENTVIDYDGDCNPVTQFQNATRTSSDFPSPVNEGTIDDRTCYADYDESMVNGNDWGVYNITYGSNHLDTNGLQPRIERSLSRSQEAGVGSYARFTGTVRILEVGDVSGNGMGGDDGSYLIQAKGKHDTSVNPNGSADPAICLYLAKAVYGTGVNTGKQVAFKIYAERILSRGGEGIGVGRELVELIEVNKNEEVSFELEVGFREDPTDPTKKIHYCDAVIKGVSFPFEIPEPEIGLESGIRYGAYRVKGGRAQMRWANTTYESEEIPENSQTSLPGTVEAESGTFGGIVGPSGIGVNNLRGGSANFVQNSVSVAVAGDYDFTFTYNRTGAGAASVTMEIVSPATTLFTGLFLPQTSGYETVTIEDVTLPTGTYDLKFYNANGNGFNLDKYEVTGPAAKPIITLLGSDPVNVTQGDTYTDAGATALASDGTTDITGSIVVGGDAVDTSTLGTYIITYNVTDGGTAADEVTRTVNVTAAFTSLPGTIEVETGDLSQNNAHYARNIVGDGNSGTSNVVLGWRKTRIEAVDGDGESGAGVDGTIINNVSVAADGNYDFTFTYFKNSADGVISINSTDASGGSSTTLASFTLLRNDATGGGTATTSSYTTQTVTGVALTTGITHITFTNADSKILNLDNVIVTATPIPTILPGTIEVEDGDLSQNNPNRSDRNVVGSGNGGTNNIVDNFRKTQDDNNMGAGIDGTIINFVSVASDGNYDFTFTYFKNSNDNTITINSTDANGGNSTQLASFTLIRNDVNGTNTATTGSYSTQTVTGVPLTTGINYITFRNATSATLDLDNIIVSIPADPAITSASNGDWDVGATWVGGVVPTATDNVIIDDHVVTVPVGYGAECIDLTVDTTGTLSINSGGSLRVSGSSTGNVTYNRNLATTNWYLVSSPVEGQGIADFYLNESPVLGNSGTGNSQLVAIAAYDNTQTLVEDRYLYYTEGQVDGEDGDDTTDTFGNGIGYTVKLQSSQDISFTGTVRTDNAGVPVTLSQGFNNFNLIGNPYLAFVNSTTFLTAESANVEPIFWMWNGSSYDTRMTGTHQDYMIAPGQGFWVEAKTENAVTFTEANQSHETDNFQRSTNTRPEIRLNLSNGSENRKTEIFYIDGTTTGFDNGFDGKMFGANSNPAIYTDLVSNSVGIKYAVQSLPNANYENMVIPVGVNAAANSEITFTADVLNIPEEYQVFLEDRDLGVFTRLDMVNAEYTVTVVDTSTEGRFFLHTKAPETLNLDSEFLSGISIYKTNNSNLRIEGLKQGKAVVRLYNILGKKIMTNSFTAVNGVENIALPTLANGVYIVQLETENGSLNKKIIL